MGGFQNKIMIQIKDNRIFVQGVETTNPELIGLALLDAVENETIKNL